MGDAFAISRALREEIRPLEEITAEDLEERTRVLVESMIGIPYDQFPSKQFSVAEAGPTLIRSGDSLYPYSRGVIFQQLTTAGVDYDHAMKLAQEMYLWLLNKGASEIAEEVLESAILERLAATGDENTVRRRSSSPGFDARSGRCSY